MFRLRFFFARYKWFRSFSPNYLCGFAFWQLVLLFRNFTGSSWFPKRLFSNRPELWLRFSDSVHSSVKGISLFYPGGRWLLGRWLVLLVPSALARVVRTHNTETLTKRTTFVRFPPIIFNNDTDFALYSIRKQSPYVSRFEQTINVYRQYRPFKVKQRSSNARRLWPSAFFRVRKKAVFPGAGSPARRAFQNPFFFPHDAPPFIRRNVYSSNERIGDGVGTCRTRCGGSVTRTRHLQCLVALTVIRTRDVTGTIYIPIDRGRC